MYSVGPPGWYLFGPKLAISQGMWLFLIIPIPGGYLKQKNGNEQDSLWQELWELKAQHKYIKMWKLSRQKQMHYFRKLFEGKDIQGY